MSSTTSQSANVVDDHSTGYRHNLFRPGMKSGGTKMQRAFVIRPFGKKTDASGTAIDFELVHEHLIAPSLKGCRARRRNDWRDHRRGQRPRRHVLPHYRSRSPRRRRISCKTLVSGCLWHVSASLGMNQPPSGYFDPIDDGREPRAFRSIAHLHNAILEVAQHAVHFPLRGAFRNDGVG